MVKAGKFVALVAVLACGLSLSAFAKDNKNETKVTFTDSVQIGSTDVKPGDYKLQWEGNGPDVQVKVIKGKDVIATAPAKLVQKNSGQNSITTRNVNDNTKAVDEIDFAGGRQSLVFNEATSAQSTGGQQ